MPRRTKEDALATRHQLLDAAERVFFEKGVSRTSLNDIALAAGATRGAIYWHFKNKADLFNAMMERVKLPMEDALHQSVQECGNDALSELLGAILNVMRKIMLDERMRRVFEVAIYKVEYVDDLLDVKQRHLQNYSEVVLKMQDALQDALQRRGLPPLAAPAAVANGLHAVVAGLIQCWLLAPQSFDLVDTAQHALKTYLTGLGLTKPQPVV